MGGPVRGGPWGPQRVSSISTKKYCVQYTFLVEPIYGQSHTLLLGSSNVSNISLHLVLKFE